MSVKNYPTRMHEVLEVGTMTDTGDYIVFDRTGTPHVVVAVKTESAGIASKAEIGRRKDEQGRSGESD